jgi:hypothetical protein
MLTMEEAIQQVDPALSDSEKEISAAALVAGALANEVYWSSRGMLEYLKAKSEGHGIIARGEAAPPAAGLDTGTPAAAADVTATDTGAIGTGNIVTDAEIVPPAPEPGAAAAAPTAAAPSPDNPMAAVAALRAQLTAAGITPEV